MSMNILETLDIVNNLDDVTSMDISGNLDVDSVEVSSKILINYPLSNDPSYSHLKHYQIDKNEFTTPQTNYFWKLTDTIGPGIIQNGSAHDIRVYSGDRRSLKAAQTTGNTFAPGLPPGASQLSEDQLHLFIWQEQSTLIFEWVLSAPHVFPPDGTPPDFQFIAQDNKARDIRLIENGRKMILTGTQTNIVRMYKLTTPNSFAIPPILIDSFDTTFMLMGIISCDFSDNGKEMYIVNGSNDEIQQWHLSVHNTFPAPLTPSDRIFPYNPDVNVAENFRMSKDGSRFFISSRNIDRISEYTVTDGDYQLPIINKVPDAILLLSNANGAITISVDESFIWLTDKANNKILEFSLPLLLLNHERVVFDFNTGNFTIDIQNPRLGANDFIQILFGNPSATDNSSVVTNGAVPDYHEKALLVAGEANFLVDDQDRNIVAVK